MTTTLTEIQIPEDVEKALRERHEETGKLSSLSPTYLMKVVPGTSRVDAQIYIALYKDSANPVHKDTIIRRQICDIIAGWDLDECQDHTEMVSQIASLVY